MRHYLALFCVILAAPSTYQSTPSPKGTVELDEISFYKIIDKFEASLVKFDVSYPYGDKHDAFVTLAHDAKDVDELVVAEVGVKDYGEKDNEALARKYGVTKDNFPGVRLFLKGNPEPIVFDETNGFTTDELRRFVRKNTGIYMSLPGCVKELDAQAIKFMKSKQDSRKKILKDVENIQKSAADKDRTSIKIYKTIMEKVLEKGDEFISTETHRVNKLVTGKISKEKKSELLIRINILQTFLLPEKKKKEEL